MLEEKALKAAGRGPREEPELTMRRNETRFCDWLGDPKLNQNQSRRRDCDRNRGMQRDAQRTVIGRSRVRMEVGDLDDNQQSQQGKAQHSHNGQGVCLKAWHPKLSLKSFQKSSLPFYKGTESWTYEPPRWLRFCCHLGCNAVVDQHLTHQAGATVPGAPSISFAAANEMDGTATPSPHRQQGES